MTAVLLLVPVAAVLAAWGAGRVLRRRGRLLRGAVAVVTALVVLLGGLQLWALAALDSSVVARAIVWREADVDDISRFPARVIEAAPQGLGLGAGRVPGGAPAQGSGQEGGERA